MLYVVEEVTRMHHAVDQPMNIAQKPEKPMAAKRCARFSWGLRERSAEGEVSVSMSIASGAGDVQAEIEIGFAPVLDEL